MAIRNIVVEGDDILRKECREVKEITDRIRLTMEDMLETMAKNAPKGGDTIRGVVPLHWTDVLEISKRAY